MGCPLPTSSSAESVSRERRLAMDGSRIRQPDPDLMERRPPRTHQPTKLGWCTGLGTSVARSHRGSPRTRSMQLPEYESERLFLNVRVVTSEPNPLSRSREGLAGSTDALV